MDCDPTCLRIIAKYYGKSFGLQELREKSYITHSGVSMLGISEAAENTGFRTVGARITLGKLVNNAPLPCILHWNQKHFVVLYKVRTENRMKWRTENTFERFRFYISPVGGKYTLTTEELLKGWASTKVNGQDCGVILMLEPTPDFYSQNIIDEKQEKKITFFFKYLIPFKSQIVQLFIRLLIGSLLSMIFPFLSQVIVDKGIGNNDLPFVTLVLVSQLALFSVQLAVNFLQNWIMLHTNTRISISLISDFLSKLMKLPLRFFDSKNIGDIMQRIGDNGRIRTFLTGNSLMTLFSFFNFIIFACILAYYNLTILLVFLVGNALYVLWITLFLRWRRRLDIARFRRLRLNRAIWYR
jgi:ATP-binding cassette subfamily B protein